LKVGCVGGGFVIIFGPADFFGFGAPSFGIMPLQRQGENVKIDFSLAEICWLVGVSGGRNTSGYGQKS
jgi:hypothetical protein